MLPPDVGRELPAGGSFGKALPEENKPLCCAFVLRGVELSGLLGVAAFFVLFVLLRMVTLLDSAAARLWADVDADILTDSV